MFVHCAPKGARFVWSTAINIARLRRGLNIARLRRGFFVASSPSKPSRIPATFFFATGRCRSTRSSMDPRDEAANVNRRSMIRRGALGNFRGAGR